MELTVRRIIIFTNDMKAMTEFYQNVLECKLVTDEPRWKDFDAGGIRIALHNGTSMVGRRSPKISFYTKDVPAIRKALLARELKLGSLVTANDGLLFFDGKDPDGNPFTISNRE